MTRSTRRWIVALFALGVCGALTLTAVVVYLVFGTQPPAPVTPAPTGIVAAPTSLAASAVPTAPRLPTRVASPLPSDTPTPTRPPTSTPVPTATVPTSTALPTATLPPSEPPPPSATAGRAFPACVSVVGDSVAYGDGVFEVPGTGYVRAHMGPVSAYIAGRYRALGGANVAVYNRSEPATGISAPNQPPFRASAAYAQLLADRCAYTVILPWINDLTGGEAGAHAAALGGLVGDLKANNPGGTVIVVNYYGGSPASFASSTFASGFTPERVAAFNGAIAAACQPGGALARAVCLDSGSSFAGMGGSYLVGATTRADLDGSLAVPLTAEEAGMVDFYFGQNPGGAITGDGVHLSGAGKAALAAALVSRMS